MFLLDTISLPVNISEHTLKIFVDELFGTEKILKLGMIKEWRMDGWKDGWMDEWMDGWMNGWMDGWMDGWMNE